MTAIFCVGENNLITSKYLINVDLVTVCIIMFLGKI